MTGGRRLFAATPPWRPVAIILYFKVWPVRPQKHLAVLPPSDI